MSRPPVVLLHGFGCEGSFWEPQRAALSEAGYRVLAPDLPCHGAQAHEIVPSLDAIADRIAGMCGAPTALLGHSMGGMVALQVARTHPETVAGLALVDAFPSLSVNAAALPGLFVEERDIESRRRIKARWNSARERMAPDAHDALWDTVRAFDAADWLSEIVCPVLGIYGGRGKLGEGDAGRLRRDLLLDRVGGPVTVRIVPGVGHFVNLEQPETVSRILLEWLEELTTQAGGVR